MPKKKKKNFYSREKSDLTPNERAALEAKKEKHKLKRKQRREEKKEFGNGATQPHTAATSPTVKILDRDASLMVHESKRLSVLFWNVGRIYYYIGEL